MPRAAHVNFQGLGKSLAMNIRYFVVNILSVAFSDLFSAMMKEPV